MKLVTLLLGLFCTAFIATSEATSKNCPAKTTTGQCCVFPFVYRNKLYTKCTTVDNGNKPWCATTCNYDKDRKWGNCKEKGVCPRIPGSLKQIDNGLTESVWGVNRHNNIYRLKGKSSWRQVSGKLKHVTTGQAGVWGVNDNDDIFYRDGITDYNLCGTFWRKIKGKLRQIDSGPYGIVYGVNAQDKIYCRTGISSYTRYGTGWQQVTSDGRLKYVSCGALGCWGVNSANQIWYRSGVTQKNCAGTGWHHISGSLKQIEAGKAGDVYGVNSSGNVYRRTGITRSNPKGSGWQKIQEYGSHITTGLNGQYILVNDQIYIKQNVDCSCY